MQKQKLIPLLIAAVTIILLMAPAGSVLARAPEAAGVEAGLRPQQELDPQTGAAVLKAGASQASLPALTTDPTPTPAPIAVTPPPAPSCPSGAFLWQNSFTVKSDGNLLFQVDFVTNNQTQFAIPNSNLPAGRVTISDAVSWDGYIGRETVSQPNERWRVIFRSNSGQIFGTSEWTPDLQDNLRDTFERGPLASDSGAASIVLPAGADHILLVHWSENTPLGIGDKSNPNSVVPSSICVEIEPFVGSIGDTVFEDTNGNGTQDAGEPGIPGVDVDLTCAGPDGTFGTADDIIDSQTTDANGNYLFTGLPAGICEVNPDETTVPPGYTLTTNNDPQTVDLGPGEDFEDADFGYQPPPLVGSIGDTVFEDTNGNGTQDAGEPGIPGVDVDLTCAGPDGTFGTADDIIDSQTTDANGNYLFTGLPAGICEVNPDETTVPPGYTLTTNNDPQTVDLGPGEDFEDADFGYQPPPLVGSIGDTVFEDTNGNGTQDAGEPGIPGVDVDLTCAGPDGTFGTADDIIDSQTTDANGNYLFTGLPAGICEVNPDETTVPPGYTLTTNNDPQTVDLGPGEDFEDADFGYQPPPLVGSIGDTVFEDTNGNGVQDNGEPGIPGVTVDLNSPGPDGVCGTADDVTIASDVTDGNGNYLFGGLDAGIYCVDPDENTVPAGYVLTTNNDPEPVDLPQGQDFLDADFGYQPLGTIGDTVFEDTNGNGVQDAGEPGIPGVTVDLNTPGPDGVCGTADDVSVTSAATDANGNYLFTGLPQGTYCVDPDENTVPAGFSLTTNNDPQTVDLGPGEEFLDADFGYQPPRGSIGDTVFQDNNGNGFQDPGEPGIPGVTVELKDPGPDNTCGTADDVTIASDVTDGNGNYLFGGLDAGIYCVDPDETTVPTGFVLTTNNDPQTVDLPQGQDFLDADFGYQPLGTIGDTVWQDDDGDGVQDPGEPGIPNVTVTLNKPGPDGMCSTADDVFVASQSTDGNGNYLFTGLAAAGYCVDPDENTVPSGYTLTTNNDPLFVFLFPGQVFLTADFGYQPPLLGSLGDFVWDDLDADGIQDSNEPGISGVTVVLRDRDGNRLNSTRTDANGFYLFDNLLAGSYQLRFIAPAGYVFSPANQGDGANDSKVNQNGLIFGIQLAAGEDDRDQDAGLYRPGSIGDTVFQDNNGNGVQDSGEPGIPGVTVDLTCAGPDGAFGTADDIVASDTTDANGNYLFTDLPAGVCEVNPDENTVPAGFSLTTNNDPQTVDLGPGETFLDTDFGYQPLGSIGDTVFQDNNGNGVQDAGEPGIPGVTVDLNTPGPDGACGTADDVFVASAVTDDNGNYLFGNLGEGIYCADPDETTVPVGYVLTTANDPQTVDLGPGEDFLDADFGYQPLGSIGDTVWQDNNGNGVQDAGEPGIPGVTVDLNTPGSDNICGTADDVFVASDVTDANGNYLFGGLGEGIYCADPDETTVPAGYALTTANDPQTVDLGPGEDFLDADFGYQPLGSIGDTVFQDNNGNGVQDLGEPGIPGVTVDLNTPGSDGVCGTADDVFVASDVTDANGNYLFTGLGEGVYCADPDEATVPAGYVLTTANDPQTVDLGPGEDFLDADFGYQPLGSIGDRVWYDNDADGVQDANEGGIPGVTINLTDCSGNDLGMDVTAANGTYLFDQLATGTYCVIIDQTTLPNNVQQTFEKDGTLDGDTQQPLAPGENFRDVDFGYQQLGSIGDTVFQDNNGNGVQDAGEPGIPGVTVDLTCAGPDGAFGTADDIVASDTTDANGNYLFTDLPAGVCEVNPDETTVPAGFTLTTNNDPQTVDLGPGEDFLDADFGYQPPQPGISIDKFTLVVPATGGSADLCDTYGKPQLLTMLYTGDNVNANTQDSSKVTIIGDPNFAEPVLIIASEKPNGEGKIYFDGQVNLGDTFGIDATNAGDSELRSETHVTIYDLNGNVLQEIEFHTSCSQPLALGDQFGGIQLLSFQDKNGAGETLPPPSSEFGEDADTPTGPTATVGDTIQWTYLINNTGQVALANVSVTDDAGTPNDSSDDFAAAPVENNGINVGDTNGDGLLDIDETWRYQATGTAQLGQYGNLGTVTGTSDFDQTTIVTASDPSHYLGQFSGNDLCETYGKPQILTMLYTGDNVNDNTQDPSKVTITGDPNFASPVVIIASEKADGSGKVYFNGQVNLGETFVIDAKLAGDSELRSETYVTVYDLNGNVLQSIRFHTSCSQPLALGDQFGSIQLVGFQDKNGGGEGQIPPSAIIQPDLCETYGKPQILTMLYTGDNVIDNAQDSSKVVINGDPMFASQVRIVASEKPNGDGKIYFDGQVNLGEIFVIDAKLAGDSELRSETHVTIYDLNGNVLQNIEFHTSCSQPLSIDDQFGSIQLVGFQDKNGGGEGDIPPSAIVQADLCETYGKPQILTMLYTGDNVIDNAQDSSKVVINGDPMFASQVRIVASEKLNGDGKIYFDGQVNLGEIFVIDAKLAGDSELRSETHVTIYDLNGNVLQNIEFHTSCSQPLSIDDQFGSIQLTGFADKNGNGP